MRTHSIALFCVGLLAGSCGTERHQPGMPSEFIPITEPFETARVATEDANVLGTTTVERNLPVDSSTGTIIYTPQEEIKKVPVLTNCTNAFQVSAATNPFLAGMPNNSEIGYPNSTDRAPTNAPGQLAFTDTACMQAGQALYFKVDGKIAFGDLPGQEANADGQSTKVVQHTLGNTNRIAMANAPIGSLIGVFLDATPTQNRATTPANLNFGNDTRRNFKMLAPLIGQIFFIGDGKDTAGAMQAFVIPQGATRLYVATMDEYEWNNNLGRLTVTASWLKP